MTQSAEPLAPPPAITAPPEPPPPAIGVEATNALPADQLTAAYKAGALQFRQGERVPVRLSDGALGTVDATEAQGVVDAGGAIVPHDVVHQAELETKYGGVGGGVGAFAAGAGRGASLGLSDPVALALAEGFGGHQGREDMRERLNAYRELHPIASGAGEVAGVVAPALLSGGAGAGGLLARGLAAPAEAVSLLGRAAERAGAGALAEGGAGALAGRLVGKAAGGAIEGALYGAGGEVTEASLGDHELTAEKLLAGAGHGAMLGSLVGGAIGVAGEAAQAVRVKASPFLRAKAEEEATKALSATKPYEKKIDALPGGKRAMGRFLLDDIGIKAGDTVETIAAKTEAAQETAGAKLGDFVKEADAAGYEGPKVEAIRKRAADALRTLKETPSLNAGAINRLEGLLDDISAFAEKRAPYRAPEDIYGIGLAPSETAAPRATKAIEITGKREPFAINPDAGLEDAGTHGWRIGEGGPEAHLGEVESPIKIDMTRPGHIGDGVGIDPKMSEGADVGPGGIGVRKAYDVGIKPGALDDLTEAAERARAIRSKEINEDAAGLERGALGRPAEPKLPRPIKIAKDEALSARAEEAARKSYDANLSITFEQARALRARIDDAIKFETNPLSPVNATNLAMKDVRNAIESEVVDAGEAAAKARGKTFADEYKGLKNQYRFAKTANMAAQDATVRANANASHSLTDKLFAGHGFAVGAAHGPLGAVAGLAAGQASKLARTRGNSTLAVMFDRLSGLQAIARRADAVDATIARGVKGWEERARGLPVSTPPRPKLPRGAVEEYRARVRDLEAGDAANHAAPMEPVSAHAPNVTGAFEQRARAATQYLKSQVPPPPKWGSKEPNAQERFEFLLKARAVDAPAETVSAGLARGTVTKPEIDAVRAVYPKLLDQIQAQVNASMAKLLKQDKTVPYSMRRDLGLLFGEDTDWSMTRAGVATLQDNAQAAAQQQKQQDSARRKAMTTPSSTLSQTDTERRQGGQIR